MSKLRTTDGVPTAADFAGHEPPLVEDFSTGVLYTINEAGSVQQIVGYASTSSTVGAAGGASGLPATPSGYLVVDVAGIQHKIPYYAT